MKKTVYLLILLLAFTFNINAQNVEVIEIVDDTDSEIKDFEFVESNDNSSNEYFILNNKRYKKSRINDVFSYYYEENSKSYNKKYGILKNNNKILPNIFSKHYSSNLLLTQKILSLNGSYGLFNMETEKWDIPMEYSSLDLLNNGLFKAVFNGNYGIIDANGKIIIEFKWKYIDKIYTVDNYYIVKNKSNSNKKGLLSIFDKKLTIPCEYDNIIKAGNTNYFKVKKDQFYNLVDINNKPIFNNWYEELYLPSGGREYYIVKLKSKMGIIDKNENIIVPIKYINIKKSAYNDGSHLAQNIDGKFGCITLDGRITMPFEYTGIEKVGYSSRNIIARNNDKCKIVRVNDGVPYEITTCDYDKIESNSKIFIVEKNNKFGMLDLYGNVILDIKYDKIESMSSSSNYGNPKLYIVQSGGKYSIINTDGEKLNQKEYKLIKPVYSYNKYGSNKIDNTYSVVKSKKNKFGLIDGFGKEITPLEFDDILKRYKNFIVFKKNNKVGLYNFFSNKLIIPADYDSFYINKDGIIVNKGNNYYKVYLSDKTKLVKL